MGIKLTDEALLMIAERFRVLSEPIRLKILQALRGGELSVSDLVNEVRIGQPNASKHLRTLQDAGLVKRDQRGNLAFYSIADESIFELCEAVCDSLGNRFREQAEIFAVV
ncbi:MAG: metalloregulator ArsR/SmtB family transcription factor [Pyrinomonadaceae bacterium]